MAKTSAGERLTDIILSNRMSKKDFAGAIGYNPSYITQICLNTKPPTLELAAKVERVFGVSSQWLLAGEENESNEYASPVKKTVLNKVNRIESDSELSAVLAFINCLDELQAAKGLTAAAAPPIKMNEAPKLYTVPVKGVVAGGRPIIAYESDEESIQTPIYADSALYIKGRSMEPDYPDGSLLLVKENAYISNNDIVIALIMKEAEIAEATCKKYSKRRGTVTLSPLNPEYDVQVFSENDGLEIKIFGKVIGIA